ncbi:MAG: 50S ribosomal protein L39e [Nanoarchaeota archaeon]
MARNKHPAVKKRLGKANSQTKWAPFWVIPKIYGMKRGRHVHPSRITHVKRNWRKSRIKV